MSAPITPTGIIQELVSLSGVGVSPDGKHITYVRSKYNKESGKQESQVWIADIDGGNRRQLTFVGGANANPTWSPDSTQVAFTSTREGDKPGNIAILPIATGGEAKVVKSHIATPSVLKWSPDGTKIAYTVAIDPENPNETPRDPKAPAKVRVIRQIDYKTDGIGYRGETRFQLFILDVDSGESRQITSGLRDILHPSWSPDGTKIAATVLDGAPHLSKLGLIDPTTGDLKLYELNSFFVGAPTWSPSGASIVIDSGQVTFHKLDVESGEVKPIAEDLGYAPGGLFSPTNGVLWKDESNLLSVGYFGTRMGLFNVNVDSGEAGPLSVWDATLGGINPTPDRKKLIQSVIDLTGTVGIASIDAETGEKTLLFEENRDFFNEFPAAQWEIVTVENDGLTIEALLMKPANFDEGKKYPLLLDIHGGPQWAHTQYINTLAQVLATNDILVLMPNPRGSTNYGKAFQDGVLNDWGYGDFTDLIAILDKTLERPYVDAGRTGVGGYSYGGYMTSWTIGHTDRFKAAMIGAPCFDFESFFGTSDIGHFFGDMEWGGNPLTAREEILKHSPSEFIHNAKTPTLIIHGEADERCPIGQGEQLFISLVKLGVETEFIRYPGAFHGFTMQGEPTHKIDFIERNLAWFKKYLGDAV